MIEITIDYCIANYPYVGGGLAVAAGFLFGLKKISKKTKTEIDDQIVDKAEKIGLFKILGRFNPFKK